jgi:hypothetical protein
MGGRTIGQEGVDGTGEAGKGGRAKGTAGAGMGMRRSVGGEGGAPCVWLVSMCSETGLAQDAGVYPSLLGRRSGIPASIHILTGPPPR